MVKNFIYQIVIIQVIYILLHLTIKVPLIHKINALFTVQQTFVDAEKVAQTMYSEEFANCIIDVSIYN